MRRRSPQHGERRRYVAGCRCDLCREANNAYTRARRHNLEPVAWTADDLLAACYCERDFVWVHRDVIRAGRTGSCGATDCREAA